MILPKELITKIKLSLDTSSGGGSYLHDAWVYFKDDEIELYDLCEKWFNKIYDVYGFIRIDIGQYKGLFPVAINTDQHKVYFNIDHIKHSWKDWFIEDKDSPTTLLSTQYIPKEK